MRKKLILLVCMMLLALFTASMAVAFTSYTNAFNNEYGTAGTNGGSTLGSCITCHNGATGNGGENPYGSAYQGSFTAIENIDSDGDGFTNIDEILVGTFPGDASSTPVTNNPPIANAAGPYNGTVDEPLQFDGSDSSDSDSTIVAYEWDFGDGNAGTGATPTHTYTTDDSFTVTLTVTDDAGDTGTDTTTATIGLGNQAPIANANNPYSGTVNEPLQFDGSGSSDPDGSIVSYEWNFGDGNTGSGPTPTHTYTAAGTYNVTLTVTDDMGANDSDMATAAIGLGNQAPNADANGPYSGTANEPVTFDGSGSSDPDGTIATYEWNFGDGNIGSGQNPTHTYNTDGSFTVTLTVTDDAGDTGTDTSTATIGPGNQPPVADANNPYNGTANDPVQFDGSSSWDPDGTIVAYDWNFGDGNTGTGEMPTHTYTADGIYNVTLTVTDDMGASDSTTRTATIGQDTQPPPPADDPDEENDEAEDKDDDDDDDKDEYESDDDEREERYDRRRRYHRERRYDRDDEYKSDDDDDDEREERYDRRRRYHRERRYDRDDD